MLSPILFGEWGFLLKRKVKNDDLTPQLKRRESQLVIFEKAGHPPQEEVPEKFNPLAVEFLLGSSPN